MSAARLVRIARDTFIDPVEVVALAHDDHGLTIYLTGGAELIIGGPDAATRVLAAMGVAL